MAEREQMIDTAGRAGPAAPGARSGRLTMFQALLPVCVGALGLGFQALGYLNHDVAWVLNSSARLVGGGTFGRDIIAANPPFIWWLSEIPMSVALATGLDPVAVFRLFAGALLALSLVACNGLLARAGTPARARTWFLATAALVYTLGAHRDFGQREWLTALLVMPYLFAACLRLRAISVGLLAGFLIGAGAGIGVAFKPYFLAAVVPVELLLIVRARSLRPVLRAEALGAGAAVLLCGLGILLLARPWLSEVLPAIGRTYWGFNQAPLAILADFAFPLLLLGAGALVIRQARGPLEAGVLTLASAGFAVSALAQAKGYSYHIFPVVGLMLPALALTAARRGTGRSPVDMTFHVALLLCFLIGLDGIYQRSVLGAKGREIAEVSDFVSRHVPPDGSFFALATHPFPGFPTAFAAERRWGSPSNSGLFLPAVVRLSAPGTPRDAGTAEALAFARAQALAAARRDVAAGPDLVLVDRRATRHAINDAPFDFLSFCLTDPEFRRLWARYRPLGDAPEGFAAFKRDGDLP